MTNSTAFDKKAYWSVKNGTPEQKRALRKLEKQRGIVAVHSFPDWPAKEAGKKRRAANQRKEQLAMIADLRSTLFVMDHPIARHKPVRKNCYYCQEPKIYRDGVCAGHWEFLYKNMSNKQRMIEKAYHRDQRSQELQRKREEARAEREQVTV